MIDSLQANTPAGRNWFSRAWRFAPDLLVLIRVPLLLVVGGAIAIIGVAQIRELFDISLSDDAPAGMALWAYVFSAGIGLLAWYSARTLYRFDWPQRAPDVQVQKSLSAWVPRALSAVIPVCMGIAYARATPPEETSAHIRWAGYYFALAIVLFLATSGRRRLSRFSNRVLRKELIHIDRTPQVARLGHWNELNAFCRRFHLIGPIALVFSWFAGWVFPHYIAVFGPMALILGVMALLIWASTFPVYWTARGRVPLITALVVWVSAVTLLGLNDNHAVRLAGDHHSTQKPPANLTYEAGSRPAVTQFLSGWWNEQRRETCNGRVYMVSSEGGGIRAALWTVLVLAELEEKTGRRLWQCTLAGSGVSGGSLGLATFAAHMRDSGGRLDRDGLVAFMESDFLAPVLGSMFGLDLFQRIVPYPLFTDRGQALENAWVQAYGDILDDGRKRNTFSGPLADTVVDPSGDAYLPALFLNTTVVADGMRLIQHPFSSLEGLFSTVRDGARWLPAEQPVFSAVHNSARFTLVSPAGTVRRRESGEIITPGQVVDGGYFENSATTTLQPLIRWFRIQHPDTARLRVIHISNDPGVAPFAPGQDDSCPGDPADQSVPIRGELRAPASALLKTRDARGEFARRSLATLMKTTPNGRLWHYRLCPGERSLPLGWTIGVASRREMERQLRDHGAHPPQPNVLATEAIVADLAAN